MHAATIFERSRAGIGPVGGPVGGHVAAAEPTAADAPGAAQPDATPLVVDLDGTLLRTDLLHETFWSALSRAPLAALAALGRIVHGRAAMKAALARIAPVDPATLPYNEDMVALVRDWRAGGGRTTLVTASDQRLADRVAGHLGLFDRVIGSDGAENLKGAAKAARLERLYGRGGYDYAGDARADLAVWAGARRAISVDAGPGLRRALDAGPADARHLGRPRRLADHLRAMRPHQWLKNILVFAPALAAHDLSGPTLALSLAAFVAFSLVASGIYLVNDLIDLAADRAHPRKRHRPFASGAVSLPTGTLMAPVLIALGLCVALATGSLAFVGVLAAYLVLTTAYSLALKRMLVIDVCVLAGLYAIRIVGGGMAAGVVLSEWLIAFAVFLFLSLAAVKRQAELTDGVARGREAVSGRAYQGDDLPIVTMMATSAGYVAALVVALYVDSPEVRALYGTPELLWGICPVLLYWSSRMVMITHRGGMHDDPIVFSLRDRASLGCGAVTAALVVGAGL